MTGAFLRVKRNDEWKPIEVEHLTTEERETLLKDDERLMQWLHIVCDKLAECEVLLQSLVDDGILKKG